MKQSEFIRGVLAGKPAIVVEYRQFKMEPITYRDTKSGAMVTKDTVAHGVEAGDLQVRVSEWIPDGVDAKTLKPAFEKGTKCILVIKSLNTDKGVLRAQGELIPLEPDEPAKAK